MVIYLGTPGRMVGISCPAEQRLETAERYSFQTTLEGRVKAQVRPEGRRVWDLRLPRTSTPSEVAALAAFANGAWGPGPFWFVSADAPVVNLLTPGAARSDASRILWNRGTAGGPWKTMAGWSSQSVRNDGRQIMYWADEVPVIPGDPVTGSVVASGEGGRPRLVFYSHEVQLGPVDGERIIGTGPQRVAATTIAPEGATHVRLAVTPSVQRVTMPAITWTDELFEWGDGQGCEKAVVLGRGRDLTLALRNPRYGRFSDYSFTVQEVG